MPEVGGENKKTEDPNTPAVSPSDEDWEASSAGAHLCISSVYFYCTAQLAPAPASWSPQASGSPVAPGITYVALGPDSRHRPGWWYAGDSDRGQ